MRRLAPLLALPLLACPPKIDPGPSRAEQARAPVPILAQLDPDAPNVYLQAIIAAGSAHDPAGQQGLAHLTARAMVQGGAGARTGLQVEQALFPLGTGFAQVIDREWVSLRLTCHRDHAALCVDLFADVLTEPRFEDEHVDRLREEALYAVGEGMLANEEDLAREVLDAWLFEAHPYGHPVAGRTGVLPVLGTEHVRAFHAARYVRESMHVGVAGALNPALHDHLRARLEAVPARPAPELVLQRPVPVEGRHLLAVATDTPVTGLTLGHPLSVTRDHEDWAALYLASVAFGEHRQSHGRLFRAMRTARGLNYGDYAYIEPFVQRGWSALPEQGVLRRQPTFSIWIRPTSLDNGPFALKLALDELRLLVEEGLHPDEFDEVRTYLAARLPLLARDPGRRLAYALDAAATDTPNPLVDLPAALDALDLQTVNAAIRRHLRPDNLRVVAVSGGADELVVALIEDRPTPIVYADMQPDEAQAARDEEVARQAVGFRSTRVVPAEGIFR